MSETDEELRCESCLLCQNGCTSAPTNKVNDCQDYERKISDILRDTEVNSVTNQDLCANCLMKYNCCLPKEPNEIVDQCCYYTPKLGDRTLEHIEEGPKPDDKVNHPSHYTQGGIECIKCIEASMKPEGFQDYCKGNVIKYLHRWREKGGVEDLKKAEVYLKWLIESAENGRIA